MWPPFFMLDFECVGFRDLICNLSTLQRLSTTASALWQPINQ